MTGVQESIATEKFPLIWGHLRNLIDFEDVLIPRSVRLVGTISGEFPVDSYFPIFLEIAKEQKREDLYGRFNCSGSYTIQALCTNYWHPVRHIPLPHIEIDTELSMQELRTGYIHLLEEWQNSCIPDNIPCAAISLKIHGNYCDEREAQKIDVLLIYPNHNARIMHLDFFEGAMDDCISPEWYLSVSKVMSIEEGLARMNEIVSYTSELQRPLSSIAVKPNFLGYLLVNGKKNETSIRKWGFEWTYNSQSDLTNDLKTLLDEIQAIFAMSYSES